MHGKVERKIKKLINRSRKVHTIINYLSYNGNHSQQLLQK